LNFLFKKNLIGGKSSQMSNKKLEELQHILEEKNNVENLNEFVMQNETKEIDQIFMEYVLETRPNSIEIFQILTRRIEEKQFNLQKKEEYYVRKLIQYMELNFEDETGALELFQTYFNTNPQKKQILLFLIDELSKLDGDVYIYYFATLLLDLNTGMGGDWPKFYDICLPIWMEKLESGMDDELVLRVLTKIINDEKIEKTKKFQMIYKKFERFLKPSCKENFEFISEFSNELTEKQIMMYVKMFQKLVLSDIISNVYESYLKIFKTILIKYPNKSDEISQQ
jgi:hypothetical protein